MVCVLGVINQFKRLPNLHFGRDIAMLFTADSAIGECIFDWCNSLFKHLKSVFLVFGTEDVTCFTPASLDYKFTTTEMMKLTEKLTELTEQYILRNTWLREQIENSKNGSIL